MAKTWKRTPRHLIENVWFLRKRMQTTETTALSVTSNSGNDLPNISSHSREGVKKKENIKLDNADDVLRKPTSIPQPFKLPLLGNVRDFIGSFGSAAHTFLQKRAREMGEIYQFQALGEKMVFLFNYKDVDAVRKAEGNCPEHIEFRHLKKYREERGLPLGVLISKGQEWRKQRRILAEPMLKPESVSKYFTGLHEVARDAVSHHVTRTRAGRSLDIERLTGKYALEASHHVDNQIERWTAEGYIPEDCILGMLYKSNRMSRDELHVNIADLLLAAIDTTSSAILWALHELSQHPQVEDEILREFDQKQGTQPLTYKDLHGLEYLRAVLKETLRLHPVAFFSSRITEHDVTIQGYDIPRKTHLACSMYVMGRDETLFPEPERFKPDRWLGGRNLIGGFFTKVPFGSGVRMCLGRRIAETEILLFLLEMCKAYRIEAESNTPIEPKFRILMVPKTPLRLNFVPRERQDETQSFRI